MIIFTLQIVFKYNFGILVSNYLLDFLFVFQSLMSQIKVGQKAPPESFDSYLQKKTVLDVSYNLEHYFLQLLFSRLFSEHLRSAFVLDLKR